MRSTADNDRGIGRWAVGTGAWILAGFLLITVALIFSAREDQLGYPSVSNTRASGYAAFAELLARDGYVVRLDRSVRPEFSRDDIVIAVTRPLPSFDEEEETDLPPEDPPPDLHRELVEAHMRNGGTVIEIINWSQFERASDEASSERFAVSSLNPGLSYSLSLPISSAEVSTLSLASSPYSAWFVGELAYVNYVTVGDGLLVTIGDGLPATNRFLDKSQNAIFMLELVRNVAPPGSSIVFDESGIGNAEEATVANTLGKWAVAARWQAGLLFAVLLFTFARRFGLPETERRAVRSSRELFDAVADVLRRTSNTGLALDNLMIECDQRMRRVLNAPSTLKRSDVLQAVPAALREQYLRVSEHANANSPHRSATAAAARLIKLLEEFERDSRAVRGLKR